LVTTVVRDLGSPPGAVEELEAFCRQVQKLSGLAYTDLLMTGQRLAAGQDLDGHSLGDELGAYGLPQYDWGAYGESRPDLNHVAARLHELDRDGTTPRLWQWLFRNCPFFADIYRKATTGKSAGHSPSPASPQSPPPAAQPVGTLPAQSDRAKPIDWLTNWQSIAVALERQNTKSTRQTIRRLNNSFDGPIRLPQQWGQPRVDRAKLIAWWNGLEQMTDERRQRQRDSQATVEEQHPFGRDGMVAPGVSGSENDDGDPALTKPDQTSQIIAKGRRAALLSMS
jgi:hypothetical protein